MRDLHDSDLHDSCIHLHPYDTSKMIRGDTNSGLVVLVFWQGSFHRLWSQTQSWWKRRGKNCMSIFGYPRISPFLFTLKKNSTVLFILSLQKKQNTCFFQDQCMRGVLDSPVSEFSLSLYRHPSIYILFNSLFTSIINKPTKTRLVPEII
jgi:hypothetical protein